MTDLPPGWAWTTIANLVEVLDSQRIPVSARERSQRKGSVPYYGATGQVGWIDRPLFNEDLLLLGEDGVQFFDRDRPKAYTVSGPSWVNNHAHVLRCKRDVVSRSFLYHYLNHFDYEGYVSGTTRLKLNQTAMKSIPVALPPLDEQHRIATALDGHLSRLDAGVASITASLRLLERWWQAVLQAAISRQIDVSSRPWSYPTIGELAEVGTGATPLRSRRYYYDNGTIPWVTSSLLNRPHISEVEQYVTKRALAETNLKIWPAGTLLLAMYGEGRTRGLCSELGIPATTNQACAAIVMRKKHDARRPWVKLVLEAKYEQNRRLAAGGVQPNLNLGLIRAIEVPLPSPELQDRLLVEVERQRTAANRLRRELIIAGRRARGLRLSLLRHALSGRLVPQDPTDEPASVLLERIAREREARTPKQRGRRRPVPQGEALV